MSTDCVLYLEGIQSQWEAVRESKLEKQSESPSMRSRGSISSNGDAADPLTRVSAVIENAFGGERAGFNSYVPPAGPEVLGELLNSRHMVCCLLHRFELS